MASSKSSGFCLLVLSMALCICYMGQSLLVTYSQTPAGKYAYSHNSSVLFSELCKLIISIGLLAFEIARSTPSTRPKITISWKGIRFGLPAFLYALHNNIVFIALLLINPVTYQLFNNLKIVTTAVVFRIFLQRELLVSQWLAILVLLLSMVVVQLQKSSPASKGSAHHSEDDESGKDNQNFVLGFLWMLLLASCSAFAGVYNEYLIKGDSDSLNWKNIQLYSFSSFACLMQYIVVGAGEGPGGEELGLLTGFDGVAWGIVLVNGLLGQVVSLIFKYGDNIVKVYATSMAVLFTSFAAHALFGTPLTLALFVGITFAIISLCLYYTKPANLMQNDSAFFGQLCPCCPCVDKQNATGDEGHKHPFLAPSSSGDDAEHSDPTKSKDAFGSINSSSATGESTKF